MKIERKKLLAALEPLKPALTSRTVIEGQSQIWFDKEFAYAHDGGFGVRSVLETPFDFGVPGKLMLGLLDQAAGDEITLEPKDTTLAFKVGKSSVKLATLDKTKRPPFYKAKPEGKPLLKLKVSGELVTGLKKVFVLKPADPKRLEHHGVCVYEAGNDTELYTTDSHVLVLQPIELKLDIKRTVIPRVFAEQVVAQCDENADLEMYSDHFRVMATENIMLFSNTLDTDGMLPLPKYADRFYDTKAAPRFTIPDGFSAALERAVLMASTKEEKKEPLVTLKTAGKKLVVSGEFGSGDFSEEFDVNKTLPARSISVPAKPLMTTADLTELMVGEGAVTLCGKDDFLYFLAAHN